MLIMKRRTQSSIRILGLLLWVALLGACQAPTPDTVIITRVRVVTLTPDPNITPRVIVLEPTFDAASNESPVPVTQRTQISVPPNVVPTVNPRATNTLALLVVTPVATVIDPVIQDAGEQLDRAGDSGCPIYTIDSGDTIFAVAAEFEADPFLTLQINGLAENSLLNVGDQIVIPVVGCDVSAIVPVPSVTPFGAEAAGLATAESTPEVTEEVDTATPTVTPTITLAPTAAEATVEIAGVVAAGDVTAEGIRIRNPGDTTRIEGWTLRDLEGNEYTFGPQIMFRGAEFTLFTRAGTDVPIARFWGLEEAVWQSGDVATLFNTDGEVQAVFRVP